MRRDEEENPSPLASRGGGLSLLSCYFVVFLRRVLLLLPRKEDADSPHPILLPSSTIENKRCPQPENESPSPSHSPRLKWQGGGQSFSFLKSVSTQTCFTLSKLCPFIPLFIPPVHIIVHSPFISPSISPSTPSTLLPQAPLLHQGGQAPQ